MNIDNHLSVLTSALEHLQWVPKKFSLHLHLPHWHVPCPLHVSSSSQLSLLEALSLKLHLHCLPDQPSLLNESSLEKIMYFESKRKTYSHSQAPQVKVPFLLQDSCFGLDSGGSQFSHFSHSTLTVNCPFF